VEFPLKIEVRGGHNHSVRSAAALRYRDVDESVRVKFQQLYSNGYSPSAAYCLHQYDLQNEHGTEYYVISGDRRFCPDKSWCYRFDHPRS
jgi:hypothetical protein